MKRLNEDRDWEGLADAFVLRASHWLKMKNFSEGEQEPNVRLIRDYVSRGILSRPERRGKEAVFSFRHLAEFLACRAMISDGWPLLKISEDFQQSTIEEIIRLIPGENPENSSLDLIKSFRSEYPESSEDVEIQRSSFIPPSASAPDMSMRSEKPARGKDQFERERFLSRRRQSYEDRSDIKGVLQRLDSDLDNIIKEDFTAFQLASWLILFMDTGKARDITRAEAEDVGKAITAALLNRSSLSGRTKEMYTERLKSYHGLKRKIDQAKRESVDLLEKNMKDRENFERERSRFEEELERLKLQMKEQEKSSRKGDENETF